MKPLTLCLFVLMASPAFAASDEMVENYLSRTLEVTDFTQLSADTARSTLRRIEDQGLNFSPENKALAIDKIAQVIAQELYHTTEGLRPYIAENYTDKELEAILAFMDTAEGASYTGKTLILGARAGSDVQDELAPKLATVMIEVMQLAD